MQLKVESNLKQRRPQDGKMDAKSAINNATGGKVDRSNAKGLNSFFEADIVWKNVILMVALHFGALLGLKELLMGRVLWQTQVFSVALYILGGLGISAGAHRLWSHTSYKAKWPLKLILVIFNCIAYQNSIYIWARDHRVHHKYSETDADPHNVKRGFLFAHIGWLVMRKHPDVANKGKLLDLSDLDNDPFVKFQHKYYIPSTLLFWFVLPTIIPHLYWNESLYNGFYVCTMLRWMLTLHGTALINSVAHMWGHRLYDKTINPADNFFVDVFAVGEGSHNFHHTFPMDYASSEFIWDKHFNITKLFIDLCAQIGWVYDRKKISSDMIEQRKLKTGVLSDLSRQELLQQRKFVSSQQ